MKGLMGMVGKAPPTSPLALGPKPAADMMGRRKSIRKTARKKKVQSVGHGIDDRAMNRVKSTL